MLMLLLESALRALILSAAVGAALGVFRVRNPHVQLTAWTVVLIAALAMPVLVRWTPVTWFVPMPEAVAEHVEAANVIAERPKAGLPAKDAADPLPAAYAYDEPAPFNWAIVAFSIYISGAILLLARLVLACAAVWRLTRAARPIHESWTEGFDVRASSALAMPATFASTILLPETCTVWSPAKRRAVLSHEQCHVARGDFYVQVLAELHRALFWFSPLAWWLRVRLNSLAETTSDDAAVARLGDRVTYAEILMDVSKARAPASAFVAMARPALLYQRVNRLLSETAAWARPGWRTRAAVVLGVVPAIVLAASGFEPAYSQSAPAAPAAPTLQAQDLPPVPLVPPPAAAPALPAVPALPAPPAPPAALSPEELADFEIKIAEEQAQLEEEFADTQAEFDDLVEEIAEEAREFEQQADRMRERNPQLEKMAQKMAEKQAEISKRMAERGLRREFIGNHPDMQQFTKDMEALQTQMRQLAADLVKGPEFEQFTRDMQQKNAEMKKLGEEMQKRGAEFQRRMEQMSERLAAALAARQEEFERRMEEHEERMEREQSAAEEKREKAAIKRQTRPLQ